MDFDITISFTIQTRDTGWDREIWLCDIDNHVHSSITANELSYNINIFYYDPAIKVIIIIKKNIKKKEGI